MTNVMDYGPVVDGVTDNGRQIRQAVRDGAGSYAAYLHKGAGVVSGNHTNGYADPFQTDSDRVLITGNQHA